METKRIQLLIESNCEHVPLVSIAVNRLCLSASFSEKDAHAIELCVTEAVVNSIKHAYGDEQGHEVVVTVAVESDRVTIDVCDTGNPMDPGILEEKKKTALVFDPENIDAIPESGRGLAIIQGFMDGVSYRMEEDQKCLRMVKKFQMSGE